MARRYETKLTAKELSMRATIAGLSSHAQGKTNTGPARKAFLDRFERQVDPEGTLAPIERAKRAGQARRAYMTALSAKAAQTRRHPKL